MSSKTLSHTLTVSGGYHDAGEITVRPEIMPDGRAVLSASQIKRIERNLCGINGCTCGALSRADWDSDTIEIGTDFSMRYSDGSLLIGRIK